MKKQKIKVLHIITRLILGGAQENTLYTVSGLQRLGRYEVGLITGPPEGPEGDLFEYCREHNIRYKVFPWLKRNVDPLKDSVSLVQLIFFLKKHKFDIVHTHSAKAGIIGRLAAKIAKVPIIIHTIHGLPFHNYQPEYLNKMYILMEKKVANYTDAIVAVAKAMIDKCVKAKIAPREKLVLIRSGFKVEDYIYTNPDNLLRHRLGLSDEHIVIGKIARLFELKGHKYIISAFKNIVAKYPNARLLLVGDGILRDSLIAQAKELKLDDKIIFTGLIPPEEIPGYISIMDIVVHTSLREGLAKVIPQAQLMAKPVVSFDIDGSGELIINKVTGMLVKPEDIHGLVNAIEYIIEHPAEANMMAIRGKKLALSLYPLDKMITSIDDLYQDLINAKINI